MKVLILLILFIFSSFAQEFIEQKILPPDINASFFGEVQIMYPHLFIGAPHTANSRGALYHYKYENNNWKFKKKYNGPSPHNTLYGAHLKAYESTLIVSATKDTVNGIWSGAVYIYKIYPDSLSLFQKLYPDIPLYNSQFGSSIDIYNDHIIVGASLDSGLAKNSGAAYIFKFNGNKFEQTNKLFYPNSNTDLWEFGVSVAIEENNIFVGANAASINGAYSGVVSHYNYENENWNYKQDLIGSEVSVNHAFGSRLDLHNNKLVVSAPGNIYSFNFPGQIYLFNLTFESILEDTLINSNIISDIHFGSSLLLKEDTLLIGTLMSSGGLAHLYLHENQRWQLKHNFSPVDGQGFNWFSTPISVSSNFIAFGAPGQNNQGAVYLYSPKPVSVENENNLNQLFYLRQNYPNPFNPTTTIKYSIKESGMVTLKIYDILGKEITTLVNEIKSPGEYTATFDASSLPSGVYIYTIRAGTFNASRKLVLVK